MGRAELGSHIGLERALGPGSDFWQAGPSGLDPSVLWRGDLVAARLVSSS